MRAAVAPMTPTAVEGFTQIGEPVPDGISMSDVLKTLPKEVSCPTACLLSPVDKSVQVNCLPRQNCPDRLLSPVDNSVQIECSLRWTIVSRLSALLVNRSLQLELFSLHGVCPCIQGLKLPLQGGCLQGQIFDHKDDGDVDKCGRSHPPICSPGQLLAPVSLLLLLLVGNQ